MPRWRGGLAKVGRVYWCRFRLGGQEFHRSTGCESREAAVQWLKAFRDSLSLKTVGVEQDPEWTLAELVTRWAAAHKATRSASHVAGVCRAIRGHCKAALNLPGRRLSRGVLEGILSSYPGTAGGRAYLLRALRAVLNWAEVPMPRIRAPRVQEKRRPTLTAELLPPFLEELESLLTRRHASLELLAMVRFQLALGLREAEVRSARLEWLDLERNRYTPQQTKGGEAIPLYVPAWIRDELQRRKGERRDGLMFPGRFGGQHKRGCLLHWVREAGEAVGLQGLTPHQLRASFATIAHRRGVPIADLQAALRHDSVRTTLRYVQAEVSWGALETAADGMGADLNRGGSADRPGRDQNRGSGCRRLTQTID